MHVFQIKLDILLTEVKGCNIQMYFTKTVLVSVHF